ncbi:MAG: hypothetical protein H8E45_13410 [Proteobacteria bacterium]|nr:hypothetical protein [Pseudomonadota bacterium]
MSADRGLRWTTAVLALLALCFVLDLWGEVEPVQPGQSKGRQYSANETVRDPLLAPRLEKIGFEYGCVECHRNFSLDNKRRQRLAEHTSIELDHGANSRCDNCHLLDKLDVLVDYEGSHIAFEESEKLCGKCHGPKYRDWKEGVHGRPNGYWLASRGESVKATCVQCHSPHSPAFKPMTPAPAPDERRGSGGNGHG